MASDIQKMTTRPDDGPERIYDVFDDQGLHEPSLFDSIVSRRVSAFLIDFVILGVVALVLWFALSLATVLSFGLLLPVKVLVLTLLPFAYATWTIGGPHHATWGMRFMDVSVIGAMDGRAPGYLQALVMTVCFYMSVTFTTWLILFVAFFSNRRRTLHDWLAATLVVRRSRIEKVPSSA